MRLSIDTGDPPPRESMGALTGAEGAMREYPPQHTGCEVLLALADRSDVGSRRRALSFLKCVAGGTYPVPRAARLYCACGAGGSPSLDEGRRHAGGM